MAAGHIKNPLDGEREGGRGRGEMLPEEEKDEGEEEDRGKSLINHLISDTAPLFQWVITTTCNCSFKSLCPSQHERHDSSIYLVQATICGGESLQGQRESKKVNFEQNVLGLSR